jgi:hypothetical protein
LRRHGNAFYSSIPIPVGVEGTMMKIFVLVALTFALIALADRAPNNTPDRDAL